MVHRLGGDGQVDGVAVMVLAPPVAVARHVPPALVGVVAVPVDVHPLPVLDDDDPPASEGQEKIIPVGQATTQDVVGVGAGDRDAPELIGPGVKEVGVQVRVGPELSLLLTLQGVEDVVENTCDLPPEIGCLPVIPLEDQFGPQSPGDEPPDGVPRPRAPRQGEVKSQKEDDHTSPFFPFCNQCPTPPSDIPASWD